MLNTAKGADMEGVLSSLNRLASGLTTSAAVYAQTPHQALANHGPHGAGTKNGSTPMSRDGATGGGVIGVQRSKTKWPVRAACTPRSAVCLSRISPTIDVWVLPKQRS